MSRQQDEGRPPYSYEDVEDDARLLDWAADLLYVPGDPRAVPWPDGVTLGRIRSQLRGLADAFEAGELDDA